MASAAGTVGPVQARVDRAGRLLMADAEIERLQCQAGGTNGGPLVLPQLAAIARLAFRLGVTIERPAILAGDDQDIHCWVRATPAGEEVALALDNWSPRSANGPRFADFAVDPPAPPPASAGQLEWASDSDLRLTDISPALASLLGLSCDDALGTPLTKLLRLIDDDQGEMPIIDALAARRGFAGQRVVTRSEERNKLVIDGQAIVTPDGAFAGFRGRASSDGEPVPQAIAPTRAPDVATREISLEDLLREPIERIIAEAEHIAGRSDGPLRTDYAGYGGDIAAAARHLRSVLSAKGDDPEFGRGFIDVSALAAEAVVLVEPIAESRGVAIALEAAPPLQASGEEHAVIQILVNLLVNALRHSPPATTVNISFAARDGWSDVTVADQGAGIAAADHKRIFERFERADEMPGGTGLGLAIARRLARSMGGEVSLHSALGEGARFTLSLPVA